MLAGLLLFGTVLRDGSSDLPIDSIAVLPLANEGGNPETEYLSDGFTEDLINSLSRAPSLRVIARTTAFRYKNRDADPLAVGEELKVRAILTGRVMLLDDQLSIQADLLDVSTGAQLWGDKFVRKLTDVLTMQQEIAGRIMDGLRLELPAAERERVTRRYTESVKRISFI
jgi:TolB-like protein